MTITQGKAIFLWGTVLSAVIFLALTYDSLVQMPKRTHEENLTPAVASGKWVWQKHNCNDCHTILGIGGYYAPDVTKVMGYRDNAWLTAFLKDPQKVWPAARKMPDLHLTDQEIADVGAFLTWVNTIDTNNWPPKPLLASSQTAAKPGAALFQTNGCAACHLIGGVGGTVGPDLTRVGARQTKEWIEEQLRDPKSHKPDSIMPSFAKLPAADIANLADYLSGLK
jgi:nitric oxide reductase subunit C